MKTSISERDSMKIEVSAFPLFRARPLKNAGRNSSQMIVAFLSMNKMTEQREEYLFWQK